MKRTLALVLALFVGYEATALAFDDKRMPTITSLVVSSLTTSGAATVGGTLTATKGFVADGATFGDTIQVGGGRGIVTASSGSIILDPNGTGVIDPRDRISNSTSYTALGAAGTPSAGYGDIGDVYCGGDFSVAGVSQFTGTLTTVGNISMGANTYIGASSSNSNLALHTTYNVTPATFFGLASAGKLLLVAVVSEWTTNLRLPVMTNPTIAIKSSNAYKLNQFLLASHDGTNGALETYTGGVSVSQRASYADGNLLVTGVCTAGETFVVRGQTYTFVASGAGAGQVNVGTTIATTVANMVTSINALDSANVTAYNYSPAVLIRAVVTGTAPNSYTLSESSAFLTASSATLTGGQAADSGLTLYGSYLQTAKNRIGSYGCLAVDH
jgi:hypothetical protein